MFLTSSYHCNPPHKQTTVKDDSTTYNFNALYPHIPHIVCVNLMQKYTRIVILIHRMTSQDDWWSFSLQIEMFSIVTFKFPDWIVLICSRTYRWWSSCKVMRVVSYRLPGSPLPLASLSSLLFCQRENILEAIILGHFAKDLDFLLLKPNIDISRFSNQTLFSLQSRQWMSLCGAAGAMCSALFVNNLNTDTTTQCDTLTDWGSHIQAVTE